MKTDSARFVPKHILAGWPALIIGVCVLIGAVVAALLFWGIPKMLGSLELPGCRATTSTVPGQALFGGTPGNRCARPRRCSTPLAHTLTCRGDLGQWALLK